MALAAIVWSSVGIKALQFVLSFSILVTLHELGHFLTARWFKCRVEKFYLFFNPWFSLWKKKVGETEYGIGWIPFGGYVKISGMMDESMDKEAMKEPAKPYEFRSKPAWQRLIIMIAGVVVNVILALVLFIIITYVWGKEYIPAERVTYGIYADSLGREMGLKTGDRILALDGKAPETVDVVPIDLTLKGTKVVTVQREGQRLDLPVPKGFAKKLNKNQLKGFVTYLMPVIVDSVSNVKLTGNAPLQKGDTMIAMNGQPFRWFHEFEKLKKNYADKDVTFTVIRATGDTAQVGVHLDKKSLVGFNPRGVDKIYGTEVIKYTFAESVPVGIGKCFETLGRYITGIKKIFTGEVAAQDSVGSVLSIGNAFPGIWDWQSFWTLTAIFSIILAFMNILPIPALDGGHALFTLVEMISGRKPSEKFMEYAQMVGMVLLLALMAYALGLDVWRVFR
ncbi:RIP metalloprotease RseP [Filimonas effusa]|uniref:Zinc metalloprotease n=1 Tax=Filimonas effusa TaxID=2508721 RepID=A0A4Q1DC60_9BACT|nr:RIP metalloprotease RseP [Filimonas effusa]RXK87094.1 RIP metalloprotease RseP [Filimonas effusa]